MIGRRPLLPRNGGPCIIGKGWCWQVLKVLDLYWSTKNCLN